MSLIEVNNLSFSYDGTTRILDNISFSVNAGEALVLAGLSGCGKTTLCSCLCGIIPNSVSGDLRGTVTVDGQDISKQPLWKTAQKVGMVFQNPDDQLICSAVEDELAFGLENLCIEPSEIRSRVDAMLHLFHLEPMALSDPATLSGGQKKLVNIASVLIMGTKVMILDEPMTGLDKESREIVDQAILALKSKGITVLAVEHDLSLADYADRILYLRNGKLYDKP